MQVLLLRVQSCHSLLTFRYIHTSKILDFDRKHSWRVLLRVKPSTEEERHIAFVLSPIQVEIPDRIYTQIQALVSLAGICLKNNMACRPGDSRIRLQPPNVSPSSINCADSAALV